MDSTRLSWTVFTGQKNIMFAYVRAGLSILAIFFIIVVILHAKKEFGNPSWIQRLDQ